MAYQTLLKRSAEKELAALPDKIHDQVVIKLQSLQNDPRPHGVKKMTNREGYRIRVGKYRILYLIHDSTQTIEIFSIGDRKQVYR